MIALARWWRRRPFTLQWHLTQACTAHCRHCYDRAPRDELGTAEALAVLDRLRATARRRRLRLQVCLTGGDPLLHPGFWDIYAQAAAWGLPLSLLGNPIPAEAIARLLAIRAPIYYQVSLEGLREHDDAMRGPRHFERTLDFLLEARRLGLTTHVMLTLTRANLDQVLPLAESLRGLTARFAFNRLAQVGEGADLEAPAPAAYDAFLHRYLAARRGNPLLGVKDNLFNAIRHRQGRPLLPGCTGHGCGAAADFVALLADGAVHACRKYPSPIGDARRQDWDAILDGPAAQRVRAGPVACAGCPVRARCGGCPAVTFGRGLRPLDDRDPDCVRDGGGRADNRPAMAHVADHGGHQ